MSEQKPVLTLNEATLRWPGRNGTAVDALAPCSLKIFSGDRVVLRGPSGSGKTSLLLLAGGMLHPSSGTAQHEGHVGFVFQTLELLPYLNVRENILLGLRHQKQSSTDRVEELLDVLGLTERAHHRPHELSTGESQRAATARSLVSNPALILADEPTGNLDDENAAIVLRALAQQSEEGAALILATHASVHGLQPTREFALEDGKLNELEGTSG